MTSGNSFPLLLLHYETVVLRKSTKYRYVKLFEDTERINDRHRCRRPHTSIKCCRGTNSLKIFSKTGDNIPREAIGRLQIPRIMREDIEYVYLVLTERSRKVTKIKQPLNSVHKKIFYLAMKNFLCRETLQQAI